MPVRGSGFLTSLEGGYPFALQFGPKFVLEPQAQVIWHYVGLDKADVGEGSVDPGSTSGVTGRVGLRGQWTLEGAKGEVWQPYVRTNVWRDSGAQATTVFDGFARMPLAQQATRMDVTAGFTAKNASNVSLYGLFGYQFALNPSNEGDRKGVWGNLGIRYAW